MTAPLRPGTVALLARWALDAMTAPTNPDKAADRRRTCLHEAGHAVAYVVLGQSVEYVSIRAGKTFRGIAVGIPHKRSVEGWDVLLPVAMQPPDLRADVERQVIATLAGEIAALYLAPPATGYREEPRSEAIAREALAKLGPRLAELVVTKEDADNLVDDETSAWQLATASAGPDAGALYREWLRVEARGLVIRYAAAILRVADALERQAVLTGDQVAALVFPPKGDTHGNT